MLDILNHCFTLICIYTPLLQMPNAFRIVPVGLFKTSVLGKPMSVFMQVFIFIYLICKLVLVLKPPLVENIIISLSFTKECREQASHRTYMDINWKTCVIWLTIIVDIKQLWTLWATWHVDFLPLHSLYL